MRVRTPEKIRQNSECEQISVFQNMQNAAHSTDKKRTNGQKKK